jgi:TRAP-type C4-dicarboxylate transport system permease large subunit
MSEASIFILMIFIFIILTMVARLPVGISLIIAAICGSLAGGAGLSWRHLVEGAFGYFDTILIILTATIFMKTLEGSGALDSYVNFLLRAFYRWRPIFLLILMFIVMFPGMITGSSVTAILSAGPLVAPVLLKLGLSRSRAAAFLAMGGILGMIAPPVNILVMIMGAGVDMPYVGITLPLLIIVLPLAIFASLWLGLKESKKISQGELMSLLPVSCWPQYGWRLIVPLLALIFFFIAPSLWPKIIPDLGLPASFFVASLFGWLAGRPFSFFEATQKALEEALPILSILIGVGMFTQIMTLTGSRGWLVVSILSLPSLLLIIGMMLSLPLFGGVSTFGSASILGVPFILALINLNALLTASALSTFAAIGELVPPAAFSARFAAQVMGERSLLPIQKNSAIPAILFWIMGLILILLAPFLDKWI